MPCFPPAPRFQLASRGDDLLVCIMPKSESRHVGIRPGGSVSHQFYAEAPPRQQIEDAMLTPAVLLLASLCSGCERDMLADF